VLLTIRGFFLVKLPFPLTLGFKQMLQRGIDTPDMDVRWVSSLSWYILNWFGLNGLFRLLLGNENGQSHFLAPSYLTNALNYLFYFFIQCLQPRASHKPTPHLARKRKASRMTTTSCSRPRRRIYNSLKGCTNGPWRISTCTCCKSMANCPNRPLRKLVFELCDLTRKRERDETAEPFSLLSYFCLKGWRLVARRQYS
jgi:Integral membrane protein EMC3/TMCO1-like